MTRAETFTECKRYAPDFRLVQKFDPKQQAHVCTGRCTLGGKPFALALIYDLDAILDARRSVLEGCLATLRRLSELGS